MFVWLTLWSDYACSYVKHSPWKNYWEYKIKEAFCNLVTLTFDPWSWKSTAFCTNIICICVANIVNICQCVRRLSVIFHPDGQTKLKYCECASAALLCYQIKHIFCCVQRLTTYNRWIWNVLFILHCYKTSLSIWWLFLCIWNLGCSRHQKVSGSSGIRGEFALLCVWVQWRNIQKWQTHFKFYDTYLEMHFSPSSISLYIISMP